MILVGGWAVVAGEVAVFAGAGGSGGGEGGVAGGGPAEPDELPRAGHDEGRLVEVWSSRSGRWVAACGVAARRGVRRGAGRG